MGGLRARAVITHSAARSYGAKDMERRFGLSVLADAVGNAVHPGLDLSHIQLRLW